MRRAPASHQCGLGTNPGDDTKTWLFLVLILARTVFCRYLPVFHPVAFSSLCSGISHSVDMALHNSNVI